MDSPAICLENRNESMFLYQIDKDDMLNSLYWADKEVLSSLDVE